MCTTGLLSECGWPRSQQVVLPQLDCLAASRYSQAMWQLSQVADWLLALEWLGFSSAQLRGGLQPAQLSQKGKRHTSPLATMPPRSNTRKRAADTPQKTPKKQKKHVQYDNGSVMTQFRLSGALFSSFYTILCCLLIIS